MDARSLRRRGAGRRLGARRFRLRAAGRMRRAQGRARKPAIQLRSREGPLVAHGGGAHGRSARPLRLHGIGGRRSDRVPRRQSRRRRAGALSLVCRCNRPPHGDRRADAAAVRAARRAVRRREAAARGRGYRGAHRRFGNVTARLAALAAVLLVSTSGAARADDESDGVLPALEACTDALHELASSRGDPPSGRLGDVCAELAAELDDRVWGEALVSTSAEDLSVPAFGELGQLIADYERPRSDPSGLDVDELARIVESLGALEPVVELSPWQRIVRFVRERLGLDDDGNAGDWLAWLRRVGLPEDWQRGIVVTLGMLAAVFVIVVVANELAARRAAS